MARKQKVKSVKTVTRIASTGNLKINKWKFDELDLIASRLGVLRSELWNEFGSLKAWGMSEYDLDIMLRPYNKKYGVLAKTWETTLYDVISDIHLSQSACIEKVLKVLGLGYQKSTARKSVAQNTLESRDWLKHPVLCRLIRKFWYRGHTNVNNQIVVKKYNCQTDKNGIVWIQFAGSKKGKVLRIPTTLKQEITCQSRFTKHTDVKKILLERTQKFQSLTPLAGLEAQTESFDATTGKDKPKTLEPKRKRTSKVNQRANAKHKIQLI